jgi:hypothetical protein
MFMDILPILGLALIMVALPVVMLRALRSRTGYCGEDPKQCFNCNRDCEYFHLTPVA